MTSEEFEARMERLTEKHEAMANHIEIFQDLFMEGLKRIESLTEANAKATASLAASVNILTASIIKNERRLRKQ